MKIWQASLFILMVILFQSCNPFNLVDAYSTVKLDTTDLDNFAKFKNKLVHDLPMIEKQGKDLSTSGGAYTNSYYLAQIDSVAYSAIIAKLKGKYHDNIRITDLGQVCFSLKRNANLKIGDYNDVYEHFLLSKEYHFPDNYFSSSDSIIIDSTINTAWKYLFIKYHTGH